MKGYRAACRDGARAIPTAGLSGAGARPLSKEAKTNRLKARLPRGLSDRGPAEIAATRRMIETIRAVYERYGFEPVETPAIEYTDALGKFLPDQDRPNEGVFSFQDDDAQWLSLRYDLTAPLARYVAENFDALPKPYRSYRFGWVFRNEKPGPGRFRQFMQFDADTVGSSSPAADAEICMMAADTMEELGIPRGRYRVKINNRKIIDGVLEAIGLRDARRRLIVMRAIDKYDRLGPDGVEALLGQGRIDKSGDRTEGAELENWQIERIIFLLNRNLGMSFVSDQRERARIDQLFPDNQLEAFIDNAMQIARFRSLVEKSAIGSDGVNELEQMVSLFESSGYGSQRILVDPAVVRGLEYYTGPVFEMDMADLQVFEGDSDHRTLASFGSVGGGGRYDGLVGRFRNENVPATGFSVGVSRLRSALRAIAGPEVIESEEAPLGPVVVTVFDRDRIADYQRMVAALRKAPLYPDKPDGPKIHAELYLGNPRNFGNQLKYADKRGAPCVVIQGGDEKAKGEVQIKDLIEGAKAAAAIASNQEWRETRPAQFAVKEEKLVEAVREVLARHDVTWNN
jgi:histidyl-tRNA synthetase